MKKHEITGYYGNNNFGDDLFVEILKGYLEKANTECLVDLYNENFIQRLFSKLKRLSSVESVTLGGGSILGTSGKFGVRRLETSLKGLLRYKYCALGVGIENLNYIPDSFLHKFDFLGIRSKKDLDLIKKTNPNAFYTSDLAYSYKNIFSKNILRSEKGNEIGIVLTDTGLIGQNINKALVVEKMILVLKSIFPNYHFNIYSFQPSRTQDNVVISEFEKYLLNNDISYSIFEHTNVHHTISHLQKNRFVVSDRLHAGILCHILEIPFLLSTHHSKCVDYLNDINYFTDRFDLENFNEKLVFEAIDWCNSDRNTLALHEQTSINAIKKWLSFID